MIGYVLVAHAFVQFVTVKGIIFQTSRRDYVENRDRLLRGLTLRWSGRESDR